jgi:SAM-dependent methyltransferase
MITNATNASGRFFSDFAATFDSLYDGSRTWWIRWLDYHFRSDIYIRFMLTFEAFGILQDKTVLDIGCGSGRYVLEAFRRGADRVIAVDPAPGMLALTYRLVVQAGFSDRCTIVHGSFPNVATEQCDHAIVMGVMDYIAEPAAFLQALHPLIGSSAAISFPSRHWLRTPLRKFRYQLRRCPLFFYDEQRIHSLCAAAGFHSIDIAKIPGAGQDYHVCLKP